MGIPDHVRTPAEALLAETDEGVARQSELGVDFSFQQAVETLRKVQMACTRILAADFAAVPNNVLGMLSSGLQQMSSVIAKMKSFRRRPPLAHRRV